MDRAWPDAAELRRALAQEPEVGRRAIRELIDACAGSLAAMARLVGLHPRDSRYEVWKIVERAGLRDYRIAAQRRAERELGLKEPRKGFGTRGWLHGYEVRVLRGGAAL